MRGLQRALELNLGFRPQSVVTAAFDLNLAGYSSERGRTFQQQALEAIRQLPGVESAAYSSSVPLSIDQSHTEVFPADKTDLRPSDRIGVAFYQVSPGFFATMSTRLLAGREFSWHDDAKSPQVAVVNLAFAQQVLHSEDAIGKRFRGGTLGPFTEVVGVVEDGKYEKLTESPQPVVFWSILQSYNATTTFEVKSTVPPAEMITEIRGTMHGLDPELSLYGAANLEQMLGFAFFPIRAAALALSIFGILAVMLAATGIHGLVAYAVAKRSREVGIRVALGARRAELLKLIVGKMAALLALGSMIGLGLALSLGHLMSSVVYGSQPRDPLVMLATSLGIGLVGLLASWAPMRQAMQADPMVALRCE
jgi:predicted permease